MAYEASPANCYDTYTYDGDSRIMEDLIPRATGHVSLQRLVQVKDANGIFYDKLVPIADDWHLASA